MRRGQVIEQAATTELLTNPVPRYTRSLLGSVLSIEEALERYWLCRCRFCSTSPETSQQAIGFAPRSSHPDLGLEVHPVIKEIPGKHHLVFSESCLMKSEGHGLVPSRRSQRR